MPRTTANIGRVIAGVVVLFAVWLLGGYVGGILLPQSELINKMETLPTKIGSSLGVVVASLLIRRYLLRSFRMALICLAATEAVVFLIIIQFTGLLPLTSFDLRFDAGWLYTLTWNVVVAFLFGAVIGQLWDRRTANLQEN